jgi:transposase
MAKPYSSDLRERVAGAVLAGRACREVASPFGVSVASAVKWAQRLRASGSAAAKPMGGKRPCILASEEAWLLAQLEACPHLTVRTLADELRARGFDARQRGAASTAPRRVQLQKNAVRRRTGSAQHRQAARAVEEVSGAA